MHYVHSMLLLGKPSLCGTGQSNTCSDDNYVHKMSSISKLKESLGGFIGKADIEFPWSVRLRIYIGVSQGISYLHKDYTPHLLHDNVKSKNVLPDEDFVLKLMDFSLDQIIRESAFMSSLSSKIHIFLLYNTSYIKTS